MLIGIIGSVIPGMPGAPIILLVAVGHRLYFGSDGANNLVLIVLTALTVLAFLLDYLGSMYGAKRFGATWRGVIGGAFGLMIGLFFGVWGIVLGAFLGAMVFEIAGGYEFKKAARAGAGATLGMLGGTLGKLLVCLAMTLLFTVNVIARSVH